MIVSIHQPDYIPYIGYFYKIAKSDTFVFLDDVQFSNDNVHNQNKIKTPQGELRLKIPVLYKFGDKINQVKTKDELKWKEKHLKTIEMNYLRAKYFNDFFSSFKELLMSDYKNLADMNITINKYICDRFSIKPQFVVSSDLNINSMKEERVIDICLALGADEYLSGNGARAYQVDEHFESRGIKLKYTDYKPISYTQVWKEFLPNMSIIDYIFNCGFDWDNIEEGLRGV
ncbi:MAG: WbqC-like protein family protein [Firmicutes bacterium ADurb.Bin193]|nr:MAG: WbqC-like protein family protein [Firmicutes bacterium ADurb.Bin193]